MTIVTRRLMLVPYTSALQADFIMLNCSQINRAEMDGAHTVSSAKQLFSRILEAPDVISRAVVDNVTRDYVGHVFISDVSTQPELGFIFDHAFWGKGYATESLKAFLKEACREHAISRVIATVNLDHQASINVLQKVGFGEGMELQDEEGSYLEFTLTCDEVAAESSVA